MQEQGLRCGQKNDFVQKKACMSYQRTSISNINYCKNIAFQLFGCAPLLHPMCPVLRARILVETHHIRNVTNWPFCHGPPNRRLGGPAGEACFNMCPWNRTSLFSKYQPRKTCVLFSYSHCHELVISQHLYTVCFWYVVLSVFPPQLNKRIRFWLWNNLR